MRVSKEGREKGKREEGWERMRRKWKGQGSSD